MPCESAAVEVEEAVVAATPLSPVSETPEAQAESGRMRRASSRNAMQLFLNDFIKTS